jgi:hypothetical protein
MKECINLKQKKMGACSIVVSATGNSMSEAFSKAVEEAREEHGNDSYNGEINNCSLAGDVTHKRGEFKEDDFFHNWILDNTDKRDVKGYCQRKPRLNGNKIRSVVKNYPQKGTRKWVTKYLALNKWTGEVVAEDESQTRCIKKGRAYVDKHNKVSIEIQISKRLVDGVTKVADIEYKAAADEKPGLYTFVGWAPE